MRRRFALPLLLLGLLALPVDADPRPDILYTTRREFVRVSPPRPLTLNVHLTQFAYDPLGLEVATVGSETTGDTTTYFVKTLAVKNGREFHRLTFTTPADGPAAGFLLQGWSPSGKYLLVQRITLDPNGIGEYTEEYLRWDLSVDPPVVKVIDPAGHIPVGAQPRSTSPPLESDDPGRSRHPYLAWRQEFRTPDADGKLGPLQTTYLLYDVERDTYRSLSLPLETHSDTWIDDSHLGVWQEGVKRRLDVVTGQISPLLTSSQKNPIAASKQYPDLVLESETRPQTAVTGGGGFVSHIVWVRSTSRQKQPLSVVGAGITMGKEDPQAVWSPTGKQLAFLNHGDLYVTDIALVPASESMADEKYALGMRLSCPEERKLAASNMKQIGLGLMQYTQDYDETYPTGDGIDEKLMPYIKSRSVFSIGSVHWAYQTPNDLSLASMDSPAETVMGTMTLPCGQVVLYADGHVKELTGKE